MTGRHRARRRDLPWTTIAVVAASAAAITVPAVSTRLPHTIIVTAPADVPWTLPATAGPGRTTGGPTRTPGPLPPHTATPVGGWTPRLYDAWQPGPAAPSASVERPGTVAAATDSPAPTTAAATVLASAPTSAAPSTTPTPTPDPAVTTPAGSTTPAASPTPDPTSPPAMTEPPPTTEPAPSPEPTPTVEPTTDPGCGHGKPRKCQP